MLSVDLMAEHSAAHVLQIGEEKLMRSQVEKQLENLAEQLAFMEVGGGKTIIGAVSSGLADEVLSGHGITCL